MIDNFPKNVHPMTQLSTAVAAMNTESLFAKAYQDGVPKSEYWEYAFDGYWGRGLYQGPIHVLEKQCLAVIFIGEIYKTRSDQFLSKKRHTIIH